MDIKEYESLYRAHLPKALRLALAMLHDEEEARDAVHDVFLRIWQNDMKISQPEHLIMRSVRNACISRAKSMALRERVNLLLELDPTGEDDLSMERMEKISQAKAEILTDKERSVLEEIFTLGHSYKEAAERLGVSVATVNKHVVNALRTLRIHFNTLKI